MNCDTLAIGFRGRRDKPSDEGVLDLLPRERRFDYVELETRSIWPGARLAFVVVRTSAVSVVRGEGVATK